MGDIYRTVTDQIVTELKAGVRPWVKPWSQTPGLNIAANTMTNRPYWELHYGGGAITTVSTRTVQALLKRGAIVPGDSLFPDSIPSQTWRSNTVKRRTAKEKELADDARLLRWRNWHREQLDAALASVHKTGARSTLRHGSSRYTKSTARSPSCARRAVSKR
jgi:N-terminal domain of anti-restriction factor ArdC